LLRAGAVKILPFSENDTAAVLPGAPTEAVQVVSDTLALSVPAATNATGFGEQESEIDGVALITVNVVDALVALKLASPAKVAVIVKLSGAVPALNPENEALPPLRADVLENVLIWGEVNVTFAVLPVAPTVAVQVVSAALDVPEASNGTLFGEHETEIDGVVLVLATVNAVGVVSISHPVSVLDWISAVKLPPSKPEIEQEPAPLVPPSLTGPLQEEPSVVGPVITASKLCSAASSVQLSWAVMVTVVPETLTFEINTALLVPVTIGFAIRDAACTSSPAKLVIVWCVPVDAVVEKSAPCSSTDTLSGARPSTLILTLPTTAADDCWDNAKACTSSVAEGARGIVLPVNGTTFTFIEIELWRFCPCFTTTCVRAVFT
jgi:hypothetical protein